MIEHAVWKEPEEYAVWKYKLNFKKEQTVAIPEASRVLSIKTIDEDPYAFVLVDMKNYSDKTSEISIFMYDTNYTFKDKCFYFDTIQDYRGIIKHVFVKVKNV